MNRILQHAAYFTIATAIGLLNPTQGAEKWTASVRPGGSVQLKLGKRMAGTITPGLFANGWKFAMMQGNMKPSKDPRVFTGKIKVPGGGVVDCKINASVVNKRLLLKYQLTPKQKISLNSLHVAMDIPMKFMAGQTYNVDGENGTVPAQFKNVHLKNASSRKLTLNAKNAEPLTLELTNKANMLLQDNRKWGDTLSVRVGESNEAGWPAGKTLSITMMLGSPNGIRVEMDKPQTILPGDDWIPLKVDLDIEPGSALDFSKMGQIDAPAGRHGYIIARKDGKLAFKTAPAKALRFYGVNLCFSAQYITHDESDQLAERLMRLGYNAVRFHHYEHELVDMSKGTTTTLKPDKLDQIEYLFAALKKRGIYVTTDVFVSRPVLAKEIYPKAAPRERLEMNDIKMAMLVNEKAQENWETFARNFFGRVNPYTKMSMAKDPALAWISMINEGNPGNFVTRLGSRVKADWKEAWNAWLEERYGTRDALRRAWGKDPGGDPAAGSVPLKGNVYGGSKQDRDLVHFCGIVEAKAFARMKDFLRNKLKCEALLTNQNAWTNNISNHAARADYDYVDDHFYVDHPRFLENPWRLPSRCPNTSPIAGGAQGGRKNAFTRIFGKPFTISEFNYSGPGRFRGVGGILTGSMGAIQDWDVIWRFAYSHNRNGVIKPSRMDYFNLAGDPLNQAADRATICLYLRGDMSPAKHSVAIAMTRNEGLKSPVKNNRLTPPWTDLAWVTKVGTYLTDKPGKVDADIVLPLGWDKSGSFTGGTVLPVSPYSKDAGKAILKTMRDKGWLNGNKTDLAKQCIQSENGDILIDAQKNMMVLNTARTAGGYAPEGKTIKTDSVEITITKTDATVWVSSVDNRPIITSKRLIVTHLTDLQNTGTRFAENARQTLLAWGDLPHLVRNGSATVVVKLNAAATAKVYVLACNGKRLGKLSGVHHKNGRLIIPVSVKGMGGARMIYEIAVE